MHRFFVDKNQIDGAYIYLRDGNDIEHLRKSLRAVRGTQVSVSDSCEWIYRCGVESVEKDVIVLRILDKSGSIRGRRSRISLFQSIPKSSKMDDVVRRTVEMGVSEIFPIFTDRTVVEDKGNLHKKLERWNNISMSAAKQSGSPFVPPVHKPVKGHDILTALSVFDEVVFPYEDERKITLKETLRSFKKYDDMSFALIIGPEGGFSDDEARAFIDMGAHACSLGAGILRTESAAFAALAMMRYEMDM